METFHCILETIFQKDRREGITLRVRASVLILIFSLLSSNPLKNTRIINNKIHNFPVTITPEEEPQIRE